MKRTGVKKIWPDLPKPKRDETGSDPISVELLRNVTPS
jgi:hypothetical protein